MPRHQPHIIGEVYLFLRHEGRVLLSRRFQTGYDERWRGEIRNMEPHKCDDLAWFEPAALPPNIVPLVRRALENLVTGRFYDSMGWGGPAS